MASSGVVPNEVNYATCPELNPFPVFRYGSGKGDKHTGRLAFLEIGLLHPLDTEGSATGAPSLQMWRACQTLLVSIGVGGL